MTQDGFLDWLEEDPGDRRVQRRLESELQDAYGYQAQESSTLRAQMAKVQGSLEQRLDRLTQAFYAFVELSDLRAELAVFEDEASVRHAALRLLRSLLRRAADPEAALTGLPADLPSCPGYWLRPAVSSVAAAVTGDEAAAAAARAEARELDPVRTAVFLAAGLALAGQAPLAFPLLPDALQPPGEQVTYAQRALWRACAHGVYGDAGASLIREWLAGHVRGLKDGVVTDQEAQWASAADRTFEVARLPDQVSRTLPHSLSRTDALNRPLVAARELSVLAAWVREAVTGEPADPVAADGPAGQAGPAADPVAAAGSAAPGGPVAAAAGPGPAVDPRVAALGAVAAALTEEGSREEIALARRTRELREIIDDRKAAARPSWDDPEDALLPVLCGDAFGTDLPLRRLALEAGAGWRVTLADSLLKAATTPPPDELTITVDRHDVRLSAAGQASLGPAYAEIEQQNAPQNMSDKLFGKKRVAEEIDRERGWVTNTANEAAAAFAGRVTELRAAGQQAAADHETVTAAL